MPQKSKAFRSGPLSGSVQVPGDKSISHRALILSALSTGESRITGLLEATDVLATAEVLRRCGVPIEKIDQVWRVQGHGVGGLSMPEGALDFGNSGTGSRLMMGVIAGHDMAVQFTGDASLCRRPMNRVLDPLRKMGLQVIEEGRDKLPLTIKGTQDLIPISYVLPVASAQVKTAVLLAGLHAPGETTVIEPAPTRDHTERMLTFFGATLSSDVHEKGKAITVKGDAELKGREVIVPGDPSSAAFLVAAALIVPGSDVLIKNVLINPTRFGFYETLQAMGANITLEDKRENGGEPIADIHVKASALKGVHVPADRAPSMIDEYPCLAVLAAFAHGDTYMEGLSELRVKESDRLSATAAGLEACGLRVTVSGDNFIVHGCGTVPGGGLVKTEMDHRIAMAFLVLGLGASAPVTIDDVTMIETSFPEFRELMSKLGASFEDVL